MVKLSALAMHQRHDADTNEATVGSERRIYESCSILDKLNCATGGISPQLRPSMLYVLLEFRCVDHFENKAVGAGIGIRHVPREKRRQLDKSWRRARRFKTCSSRNARDLNDKCHRMSPAHLDKDGELL